MMGAYLKEIGRKTGWMERERNLIHKENCMKKENMQAEFFFVTCE